MIKGGIVRVGAQRMSQVFASFRKSPVNVNFAAGVKAFSRDIFPVHVSLWNKNISEIHTAIHDKYSKVRDIKFDELRSLIEEVSVKHNLGVRIEILRIKDVSQPSFPGMEEIHEIPVLMAHDFDISVRSSLMVILQGKEQAEIYLVKKEKNGAILAMENKPGVQIVQDATESKNTMIELEGAGTEGYGTAKARVIHEVDMSQIKEELIPEDQIKDEDADFNRAFEAALKIFDVNLSEAKAMNKEAGIISVSEGLRMGFPENRDLISGLISKDRFNTKKAVNKTYDDILKIHKGLQKKSIPNTYHAAKRKDVNKQLRIFLDNIIKLRYKLPVNVISDIVHDIERKKEEVVIVAREISHLDAVLMSPAFISGVVLKDATRADHTVILFKNSGIPVVFGLEDTGKIKDGDETIVAAEEDKVIVNPNDETRNKYIQAKTDHIELNQFLMNVDRIGKTMTMDGREVHICGNADDLLEAMGLWVKAGSTHGIGLLRSEIFYMSYLNEKREKEPTEEEQVAFLEEVCTSTENKRVEFNEHEHYKNKGMSVSMEVVLRTIDLGADKKLPFLDIDFTKIVDENLMPIRGLKLCLVNRTLNEMLRRQIRSILLASNCENLKIMFPMVDTAEDFQKGLKIITEVKNEIKQEIMNNIMQVLSMNNKVARGKAKLNAASIGSMIVTMEEAEITNKVIDSMKCRQEIKDELKTAIRDKMRGDLKEGLKVNGEKAGKILQVGAMIETPKAVNNIEQIVKVADFISIGTNDLTHFITGASRLNPKKEIRKQFDECTPAVLWAIKRVIDAVSPTGKSVSICGDFASNPMATFILLGLGLDKFSMSSNAVPMIKHIIKNVNAEDCKVLIKQLEQANTAKEVREITRRFVLNMMKTGKWNSLAKHEKFRKALENKLKREAEKNI